MDWKLGRVSARSVAIWSAVALTAGMVAMGLWLEQATHGAQWFRYVAAAAGLAWALGGFWWSIRMIEAGLARTRCARTGHRPGSTGFCTVCHRKLGP